jgi:Glycosyl hydrolase family 26
VASVSAPVRRLLVAVAVLVIVAAGVGLALVTGDAPESGDVEAGGGRPDPTSTVGDDASPTTDPEECEPPAGATAALAAPGVHLGVSVPDWPFSAAALDAFDAAAGRRPALVMWFVDWTTPFPADGVEATVERGALPVISWDPTLPSLAENVTDVPEFRLATIIAGQHDAYIREFAMAARDSCRPLMLRLASEMNGNWHPWSETVNGNQPGEYVRAWQHVHDIFRAVGATNVSWLWNPNVIFEGGTPMAPLYPGDAYVDWVGLSGYNWGTVNPWNRWHSFAEIFDASLAELATITSRPVLIGETASTEVGGDKAAWITDMFAALAARPTIRGFIWFEFVKETDWRIISSAPAQSAFAAGATQGFVIGAPVPI